MAMRIGILTYHSASNYGAFFQAYALQAHLKQQGHDVRFINRLPIDNLSKRLKRSMVGVYLRIFKRSAQQSEVNEQFRKERDRYFTITKPYSNTSCLSSDLLQFDAIIVGSDQVWNVGGITGYPDPFFFLDFKKPDHLKKISYAACFGQKNQAEEHFSFIKKRFADFDCVSVRNVFSQELFCKLTGKTPALVCDPAFFPSLETLEQEPNRDEEYVFV